MIMPNDDNCESNSVPFKGPFKGKGKNRRIVKQLEFDMNEIKKEMEAIVKEFNNVFSTTPRVANLRILRRPSYPLMWWRMSTNGGKCIQLFNSKEGRRILNKVGPHTLRQLALFDKTRIEINSRCRIVGSVLESYRFYMEGMDLIDTILSNNNKPYYMNFYQDDELIVL